jgi:hypothetical protein
MEEWQMHDEHDTDITDEYAPHERALFDALPRESAAAPAEETRTVEALRSEGYFRRAPHARLGWIPQIAAAAVLFAGGGALGAQYGARHSIEAQLARTELSLSDRVLLLQRAGSAYVRAANGYADATATLDSSAVEVARNVLIGAAHAVARQQMDGAMSIRLTSMLHVPPETPVRTISQ